MSKLKIAICDDESRAVSIISGAVKSVFQDYGMDTAIESFLTPEDLLARLKSYTFDLIFLDITMPKMDGIELAKALKSKQADAKVVFVSSRMDRMFDTFAVQPFGFVRKSHFLEDIGEVIARFADLKRADVHDRDLIQFKDGQGVISIDITKVKYIESVKNTQVLHFDSAEERKLYSRMEILEEELKKYGFIRIHKGYLVSASYIRRFDKNEVTLVSGEVLPVGRTRKNEVMDEYLQIIGEL